MDDQAILSLTCATCDNPVCIQGKKYAPIDSLYGCNRQVPQEVLDRYNHYIYEVIPFWHLYKQDYVNKSYFEIYNFLQEIYQQYPIISFKNGKGKVVKR